MELNEYQKRAMSTCLPSCDNDVYMINGLTAEVGEINDKIAKWVRKGIVRINDNKLIFNTSDPAVRDIFVAELIKEIGDVVWFTAGLANTLGVEFNEVAQVNLDKLASRMQRGVIDGNGDNR